jgi:hypothetical protein
MRQKKEASLLATEAAQSLRHDSAGLGKEICIYLDRSEKIQEEGKDRQA